jgi:purine-binding chemotaxis protein CheW
MSTVHVRVRAGAEDYALPVESVLEVAEHGNVAPVPGASAEVLGVRNLRGQVIPVLDLAAVFGLADDAPFERVVVAEDGERTAGFAVEAVLDVIDLPGSAEESDSPYLAATALIDGTLVGVVDVGAVLAAVQSGDRR